MTCVGGSSCPWVDWACGSPSCGVAPCLRALLLYSARRSDISGEADFQCPYRPASGPCRAGVVHHGQPPDVAWLLCAECRPPARRLDVRPGIWVEPLVLHPLLRLPA